MNVVHTNTKDTYVFGFWLYIMSDCLLFASLFATFAVLQGNIANGPSAQDIFSLPFVLLETLILLTSSFTCGLAVLSMRKKNRNSVLAWLIGTALLGSAFIALELFEFTKLVTDGHSWEVSAFLSAFFTLVGTHGLHVSIGLLWLFVLIGHLARNGITDRNEHQFIRFALFWHFLDVIWIFIFSFVYIIPLLL
jgi:cytochrome o ubiquinol oxidase subunit 3